MNAYEIAKEIHNADDIKMAEIFAIFNKMRLTDRMEDSLKREDMDFNVYDMCYYIESTLREIIFSEEIDSSAWWKDDEFFGRDTPKAKFNVQTAEFKSRRLMETAMVMNNIYNRMVKEGKIFDGGIKADVFDVLCDLAREFEETFFETDEYEDDYVAVIEKWLPEKLANEFGAQEVSA